MNEKMTTPEKHNLLLARAKAQIESMREIDLRYAPEYDLLERLFGKNIRQAARIIAEEFVARFGTVSGTVDHLAKRLSPSGRAGTWAKLDERISKICWVDNCEWSIRHERQPDIPEEELFFLSVKDVIDALPKRRDYKAPENRTGKKIVHDTPKRIADNFVTCELCWRSVPKLDHRKKIHLCHLHDIPSASPEYRRRKSLQKHLHDIIEQLKQRVMTPFRAERKGYHPAGYVWALCVDKNSQL